MKKFIILATLTGLLSSGCYQTQEGRFRAGVPMSTDTIESKYERSVDEVFEAARKTLTYNGTLISENAIAKVLTARVDTHNIWVKVELAEPTITRIFTQARASSGRGDIHMSAEIDKQIALNLRVMPTTIRQ